MRKNAFAGFVCAASLLACRAQGDAAEAPPEPSPSLTAADIGAQRTVLLAFLEPGENWPEGNPLEHPVFPEHAAYMTTLLEAGVITRGGPFGDLNGALLEFVDPDPAEAARFLDEEPFILAGVWTYTLRPWLLAVESR